ncbi:hypothetical protein [Thiolapillus sp.]
MLISSIDAKSWLRIDLNDEGYYTSYDLEAFIDIGHGVFSAHNSDIQLLHPESGIAQLDRLVTDRNVTAEFRGTYDTFLRFYRPRDTGSSIYLEFLIGDALAAPPETIQYSLRGAFEIDQEYILRILDDFRKLTCKE